MKYAKTEEERKKTYKIKYVTVVVPKLNNHILSYILKYIKYQKIITENPSTPIQHHPQLTSKSP